MLQNRSQKASHRKLIILGPCFGVRVRAAEARRARGREKNSMQPAQHSTAPPSRRGRASPSPGIYQVLLELIFVGLGAACPVDAGRAALCPRDRPGPALSRGQRWPGPAWPCQAGTLAEMKRPRPKHNTGGGRPGVIILRGRGRRAPPGATRGRPARHAYGAEVKHHRMAPRRADLTAVLRPPA